MSAAPAPIPGLLPGAVDFYRAPHRFAQLRDPAHPLPAGVTELLAAGAQALAPEHIAGTAARLGSNPQELQDALLFFIRQAMLEAGGDHYRTLGVPRDADTALIRQHYHYLIRLFHPDRDQQDEGWDTPYATAVNDAWNVLRNPQKRAAYDAGLAQAAERVETAASVPAVAPAAVSSRRAPRSHRARASGAGHWKASGRLGLAVLACLALALAWLTLRQPAQPALRVTAPAALASTEASGRAASAPDAATAGTRPAPDDAAARGTDPARQRADAAPESDAAIEARIRARMQQATLAVLGPERARASSRPVSETPKTEVVVADDEIAPEAMPPAAGPAPDAREPSAPEAPGEPAAVTVPVPVPRQADVASAAIAPADPQPPAGRARLATAPPVPQAPEALPALTDADRASVLRELAASYAAGDARRFAALFAEHAETTDATGRSAIEALYREFFARPESRQMRFKNMRWRADGPHRSRGEGKVELATRPLDGDDEARGVLKLRVEVEQSPRGPRITGLDYR